MSVAMKPRSADRFTVCGGYLALSIAPISAKEPGVMMRGTFSPLSHGFCSSRCYLKASHSLTTSLLLLPHHLAAAEQGEELHRSGHRTLDKRSSDEGSETSRRYIVVWRCEGSIQTLQYGVHYEEDASDDEEPVGVDSNHIVSVHISTFSGTIIQQCPPKPFSCI